MNQENEKEPSGERVSRKRAGASRMVRRLVLLPLIVIAALYFLSMNAARPQNLGVVNGQLAQLPDKPNCVSTQTQDTDKRMEPIPFDKKPGEMVVSIKDTLTSMPRVKLVSETENYLHFEFTSLIFRFIDDVEFFVDDRDMVVHFRSASRVGHSDLGANRKRMQLISEKLK